ncbi:hypothetical protein ABVT39_002000 [Epinephelus coioides]
MVNRAEQASELKRWCRGEGLDEAHGLMVIVPENAEISQIEDTLATIKCLGRVRVRGRIFNTGLNRLMVLCECKEALTGVSVPSEVSLPEGGEPWPLVTVDVAPAADEDFNNKLKMLLQAEGKTMEDLKALLPAARHSAVVTKPCETKEEYSDTIPATTARTCEKHQDSELTALKKQVKRLQQKLNNKVTASDAPDNPTAVSTVEATTRAANFPIRTVRRPEEQFCYRCGENGHFAAKCRNQENHSKVIKKLIQALRLSKETQSSTSAAEAEVNCAVKRSLIPVLVGTNTSHVRNLVKHCRKSGVDITRTLGIRADSVDEVAANDCAFPTDVQDDDVGFLTWQGPGPLILPPGKDTEVVCKVDFTQPVETQDSDSSSDFEYYRLPRPDRTSSENLEQRTRDIARSSAVTQEDETASLQSDEIPENDSSEEELLNGDQELNQDADPESETGSEQEDLGQDEDRHTQATNQVSCVRKVERLQAKLSELTQLDPLASWTVSNQETTDIHQIAL